MIAGFLFIIYLSIGLVIARWHIIKGKELIFNDAVIHQLFCSIVWPSIFVMCIMLIMARVVSFLVDPIIKRL